MLVPRRARPDRSLVRLRVRALLAGGLVLGVGATVTLATWTDDEYATTTFTAGRFGVEGSSTSATTGFSEHATSGAAAVLTFTGPPTAMAPGNTTYGSFWVRTLNPSVAGTVQLLTPTFATVANPGLQNHLTYGVRLLTTAQACNATAFTTPLGTAVVAQGTAMTATLAATPQVISANQALTHHYCFAVTLPTAAPNAAQGLAAVPVWQFSAVSS